MEAMPDMLGAGPNAESSAPALPSPQPVDRDPFEAVLALGDRAARVGLGIGLAIGILSHGAVGGRVLASPTAMRHWAEAAREQLHAYLWGSYDIEVVKPEAPKPVEKPKEPDKEPDEPAPVVKIAHAAPIADQAPPPPPAQAGRVLTAPSDPNEPVDLTAEGFAQGNATNYTGGSTAPNGTGTVAVYNPHVSALGRPGGTGTGSAAPPPPQKPEGPDLSKPPGVASGASWSSCEFPSEADVDQVDYAVVTIVVTVRPDGTPQAVRVQSEPGHGFGRAARNCALSKRYTPGTDHDGNPTTGTTPPIRVTFTR